MRRQFRQDWRWLDVCRDCSYTYVGGGHEDRAAQLFPAPWAMDRFKRTSHPERMRGLADVD